jgi:mannose-6-phosphate isomerase class I
VEAVRQSLFQTPELLHTYGPDSVEYSVIDRRATPCFHVRRLKVTGRLAKREDSFYVGVVVAGQGRVTTENACWDVRVGDKILIPFSAGEVVYESDQGMEWILAFPPQP